MPLFTIFVFGAVVFGSGTLLSPAWPTRQPRIGLAAALALALVVGGAVFWAMLFGWSTLVIDYLLFALITTIFLGGTLAYAQTRAEAKGETLTDANQGWPGPQDLAFLGLVGLLATLPALALPVPLDTDAQGFGYLALMSRLGGSFDTLGPFNPDIHYLYAPGFSAITAYLSGQLGQSLSSVQFGMGAVLVLMCVWLAYDFGAELADKPLGRAMSVAMMGGLGLYLAYLDSHYTSLMGLVFALAFLTYAFRYLRYRYVVDAVAAGLMLGAVVITHPDTTIILGLGFAPWLLLMWFGEDRPTPRIWLVMAAGIPLVALLAVLPWLLHMLPLLGSDIVSPFSRDVGHWRVMVFYHGVVIVPVALVGAVVALRARKQAALLAVGWLALVVDFSMTGILETLLPGLLAPVVRYDYPFSIAWHGPIIPYTILGGFGLLWLYQRFVAVRWGALLYRYLYVILGGAAALALLAAILSVPILRFSKDKVAFFGAFASHDDVRALEWIRRNTPLESRLLNFPPPQEGDWVPVIAERDSVYYRWQPFFHVTEERQGQEAERMQAWQGQIDPQDVAYMQRSGQGFVTAEQARLFAFWRDPADDAHAEALKAFGIDYVVVPQIVGNPDSFADAFRWRAPFAWQVQMQSAVSDAAYLELVFDSHGAQVYRVK